MRDGADERPEVVGLDSAGCVQGEEMRRARFNRAERKAARAPSIMILPIAVFIMPAIFVVIGTPVLIRIQSSGLGGMMQ